jgi:hypothetical protein
VPTGRFPILLSKLNSETIFISFLYVFLRFLKAPEHSTPEIRENGLIVRLKNPITLSKIKIQNSGYTFHVGIDFLYNSPIQPISIGLSLVVLKVEKLLN